MNSTAFNPNTINLDSFVYERLDELDDLTPDASEPTFTISGKKNRYAAVAEELAQKIILTHSIKVVGRTAYLYDFSTGCYRPIPDLTAWLYQTLDHEQREKFRMRDLDEVAKRLLYSIQLQACEDAFNASNTKINLSNGIWDASTGRVSDHLPGQLYTYSVHARFFRADSYKHPVFDEFCRTSLDNDPIKKQLLLEMLGVILSDYPAKAAFFLIGESSAGKSVLLKFITALIGKDLISDVPLHRLSDRFNLAELWGKKLNIVGEIKGRKLTDITTFKTVTGGDRVQAERKGKDPFNFVPRAKLVFAGNALPKTSEDDDTDAFANRIIPLRFNTSIAPEKQDDMLKDKLWLERDAIVSDALCAYKRWLDGGRKWSLPQESIRDINRFRSTIRSDKLFLEECCERGESFSVSNVELRNAYKQWCDENGFTPVSRTDLYDTLDNLPNIEPARVNDAEGHRRHGRKGIQLRANSYRSFGQKSPKAL